MRRSLLVVMLVALMVMASAGAALAGEVSGNGKSLHTDDGGLHGASACAYSGEEDLRFFTNDEDEIPKLGGPTKGDLAHAQSWGQIPKDFRDFLSTIGAHPGQACNPNIGEPEL